MQGRAFSGSLAELLVYNRSLSDPSRDAVEAYLVTKWPATVTQRCFALPNCTLPASLVASAAHLTAFVSAMLAKGFAATRYELAHAQLGLDSVAAWNTRCAGLYNGDVTPLANAASEAAADALVSEVTSIPARCLLQGRLCFIVVLVAYWLFYGLGLCVFRPALRLAPRVSMACMLCAVVLTQYVTSAGNLYTGLAAVIATYETSDDPLKSLIYALWQASA